MGTEIQTNNTSTVVEQKENDAEVFDLSSHLGKPTEKPSYLLDDSEKEKPTSEISVQKTFVKEVDVPAAESETTKGKEVEEPPAKPQPNFINSKTVSQIIANSHQAFLPPLRLYTWKNIFFKKDEFEKAVEINDKIIAAAVDDKKPFKPNEEEKRLVKVYKRFCDYRDNKTELTEEEIENLQAAWAWQLEELGLDDVTVGVHPLFQVYGMLIFKDATNIIGEKWKK